MNRRRALVAAGMALLLLSAAVRADETPRAQLDAQTLQRDVDTAGFYELVAWLESLGLSTQGDRATLARRIYEHYGIPPQVAEGAEETSLVVDSAARSRYFTLNEIEERYVRLSGGVTLTLRDDERGVIHQIVADEVTYNQDLNVLSASGDVVYTLNREGTIEQFSGEALTVQLDSWEGAFVRGVTERTRTIEGKDVDFSFAGSYITRSADDVVVMEDGRVTSSRADPPNYEIRARKIWVLAPGEWGLRNASLYVGRVPVFYFPFFFRPGNELFFNPSVGARDREGAFIQTTSYLRGNPEASDAVFSFLQIAEEGDSRQERRIEGLYLVPDETSDSAPQRDSGATLRVMGDIYTKLGAYLAIDGVFPEAGPFRRLEFFAALAVSRHLYAYASSGGGLSYSPYLLYQSFDPPGSGLDYITDWNSTRIGSLTLPFRFGAGLSAGLSGTGYSVTGDFTSFSDSRFTTDFDRRAEKVDWLGLVGQGTPLPEPAPVSGYEWAIRGSLSPGLKRTAPWLQRAELQNIAVSLRLLERKMTAPATLPGVPINPDTVTPADAAELATFATWLADGSPETGFFYPERLQLPSITGALSGQIFNRTSSQAGAKPERAEEPSEVPLRPPWNALTTPSAVPDGLFRLPETPGALPAPRVPELWSASLGYSLTPTFLVESTFDHQSWAQADDVDFSLSHSTATGRLTASLPLRGNLVGNLLSLNGSVATNGQYRGLLTNYEDRGSGLEDSEWNSLKYQGYTFTSANAVSNTTIRLQPFPASRLWSRSSLGHTLNLLLFQTRYTGPEPSTPGFTTYTASPDDWETTPLEWNDEYVRAHQLQLTAALDLNSGHSLRFSADLPPRTGRLTGQLDLGFAPFSMSVGSGVQWATTDLSGAYAWQPVASTQTLKLGELGQLQNRLSVEIEQEGSDPDAPNRITGARLDVNRTTATVGPVRGALEFRRSFPFTFDVDAGGWQVDSDQAERLRASRAELSATLNREFEPMWRNRLELSGGVQSAWSVNLLKPTESSFTFGLSANVEITEFLSMTFSSQSANGQSYVYVGPWAELVGRERQSLLMDLAKSFNFFSRGDRLDSPFNLQQIRIDATHYLEDWDLIISYSGRPEIVRVTIDPGTTPAYSIYEWQSSLEIRLEWRAIRELKTNLGASSRRSGTTVETGTPAGTRPPSEWDVTIGSDS